MPTDVAVASSGEIFVSDGYCNSRIVKFDKDGKYLGQMGDDDFKAPHGIALAENLGVLCIADRDHVRVVCLNAGLEHPENFGVSYLSIKSEAQVHAIGYSREDRWLHVTHGGSTVHTPSGFTINLTDSQSDTPIAVWWPDQKGFLSPHDIAVSPDGKTVYVCEVKPPLLWKFDVNRP
ncbi:hypothetical protein NP493_510g01024 [Ridgeia piscesae]|uniref:Uncharacterized protein n=1 Tax=Ridgeia piscesae TaxID=27915 RepID=A0AAD9NSI9_RIDPI|nr:hypothetical protein NP493_510g01024 [Ridgeia piscesae]